MFSARGELKQQLELIVRNIQWSYAIFWVHSPRYPGVLEWGEGFCSCHVESRRSDEVRELYHFLSAGDATVPASGLSAEELSGLEWFYLLSMSFLFRVEQGLPGLVFVRSRPMWLSEADAADSKLFNRSLLAKSASIQTVLCLPFLEGVVELGATETAMENAELIDYLRGTFAKVLSPVIVDDGGSVCSNSSFDEGASSSFGLLQKGRLLGSRHREVMDDDDSMGSGITDGLHQVKRRKEGGEPQQGRYMCHVALRGEEVRVNIECCWREGALKEIVDSLRAFGVESLSVQSDVVDGVLIMAIQSEDKRLRGVSTGTIKEVVEMVVMKR